MLDSNTAQRLKAFGAKQVISYIDKDPDSNIPKLLDWIEKHDKKKAITEQINSIRIAINSPGNNWYKLIKSLWTDIDDDVRKTIFVNFVVNESMIGAPRQIKISKEENCNVPWAILMDPTSACNLKCKGCWAAEYGNKLNLSLEKLDDIINQGKELGIYFYIYSGGEPLVRKKDIITLCEKHDDCVFLAFTNATLIDDKFAKEMLRVKNFVPAISVEGFQDATDARRGKGTYRSVTEAMKILKANKLPFGISCCYTSQNYNVIGSEEYFDEMIKLGAKFAWLFTYIPVGADALPELMVDTGQREFMYHKIRQYRKTKPIFTMDFWNDGEFVGGCIAGGRSYLHINANGDVEPCAFIHYSDANIKEKSLIEALKSPLFMQYHDNQPFNENHLCPCPLLDNPHRLSDMVVKSGAGSTDFLMPEDVHELTGKCFAVAKEWAETADRLWKDHHFESSAKR